MFIPTVERVFNMDLNFSLETSTMDYATDNPDNKTNMTDPLYWDYPTDDEMQCNITCCTYLDQNEISVICFDDKNFTDSTPLTEPALWSLAVRWILIVPPLVLCGVFGNLAIIIILINNRLLMKTSVNQFILNMAISDLILAATGPITFTIRDTHQFWVLGPVWCHLDGFIQVTVMIVSVSSLSTISIDRLLGILYPMHTHLKNWQSILIIAFIWVLSAACAVPFYIYRIYGVREWSDITEVYCDEITNKTSIYWLVIIIVLNWIPLTIMIGCYTKLFLEFKKHALKVEGKEHPGILNMKKKFVKMLFTMIIVFAACWLPFQMFIIYREKIIMSNESTVEYDQKLYRISFTVTQYIIYLNPAVSPFIYGLMHDNFKKGFRVTFPCFFKNKPDFVLVPSYGSQAYVWNRHSRLRHTIPSTGYRHRQSRRNNTEDAQISPVSITETNQNPLNIDNECRHSPVGSNRRIKISFINDIDGHSSTTDITDRESSVIEDDGRRSPIFGSIGSYQRTIASFTEYRQSVLNQKTCRLSPFIFSEQKLLHANVSSKEGRLCPINSFNTPGPSPLIGSRRNVMKLKRSSSTSCISFAL